ncbi:alpha/beta hydrolase [Pseudoalteromonas sp. S2755]|uniref:alpha/beta hydrolase n=1 Tax=Pseudoalteromonas sp. S2755 TaxID=2066523 RepID=UPI00110B7158|nr:alpha/beta hydrolase [Pseudoalteromonas sp. S2755]TMN37505.1 alpha/beta hydrolase [Pseudoalteromonas sp. S2755]
MNSLKTLVAVFCLASVVGCNSNSNSKTTITPKPAETTDLPLANYRFSESELKELLDERAVVRSSVKLNFQGQLFDKVMFSEQLNDSQWIVKLENANGKNLDLLLDNSAEGTCFIYSPSELMELFDCSDKTRTVGEDSTVILSASQRDASEIQVEFSNQVLEFIEIIGSTVLTASTSNNQVTVTTSFGFEDFFTEILKMDGSEERVQSTLGLSTYTQLKELTSQFEGTKMTLNFANHIGGSADDDVNMYTGMLIREHNMTTLVSKSGSVFSGGTDLFAAGNPRILRRAIDSDAIEDNKQIGVHSWSNGDSSALDIPYTDASHRRQATYFKKMLGDKGVSFYIFTLESAPAEGEHWVTKAESEQYGLITTIE